MRALRQCVRWFLVVVCVGLLLAILFGLVGEWFIELAKEKGFYEQPSAHLDAAMTAFSGHVTQGWVLLIGAFVAGLTGGFWLDALLRLPYWTRRSALPSLDGQPAFKPEHEGLAGKSAFDVHSQKRLAARLKDYAKANSSAEIRFASLKQMELAETIEAIFTAAGWETNYWNIPDERRDQRYLQGIEVAGHNRFLIPALASELSQAGLASVRAKVEEPEIPMSADGWASIENSVRVTIGHD